MTLSVTIYFPVHCGHTGSPDWGLFFWGGDVPQGGVTSTSTPALWPCAVLWPCTFCSDRRLHVVLEALLQRMTF